MRNYNFLIIVLFFAIISQPANADQMVYLSSLDLTKATTGWSKIIPNRSIDNHPITINGKQYEYGFGTHAFSTLGIDLNDAKRFTSTVGIDDEAGKGKGSVEFRILDAETEGILWRSGIMHQGDQPKEIDITFNNVKKIVLMVTDGGDGSGNDHADWADAKFFVNGTTPAPYGWNWGKATGSDPVIYMGNAGDAAPHIRPPYITGIFANTPFLWKVPVTGKRPLKYQASNLPMGLKLDSQTGIITGKAKKNGNYAVTIKAYNAFGTDTHTMTIAVGSKLAITPPIGWNSYDCYGGSASEDDVLKSARVIADKLQPYGWDTVVIDYRWYDPQWTGHWGDTSVPKDTPLTIDKYGRLLPSPNRFPSAKNGNGFKTIADKIHAMGLKFGIHIMRGMPRRAYNENTPIEGSAFSAKDAGNPNDICIWLADNYGIHGDTPAGQAYYDSIIRLYASWGVDYIKMDDTSNPYHKSEAEAVHRAIMKYGRSIVLSLSPGPAPVEEFASLSSVSNLWRATGDFWDNWEQLRNAFSYADNWRKVSGPGNWADLDMLPIGRLSVRNLSVGPERNTNYTKSEQLTLMSLWAIFPSPYMMGGSVIEDFDPWTVALLTNPEVIAIHQDMPATPDKFKRSRRIDTDDVIEIWDRVLSDGSTAVAVFNKGLKDQSVTVTWRQLGISGRKNIRDLWRRKDMGTSKEGLTYKVTAHGAALFRLYEKRTQERASH